MKARHRRRTGRRHHRSSAAATVLSCALAGALTLGGCATSPQPSTTTTSAATEPSASTDPPATEPPGHDDDGADLIYTPGARVEPEAEAKTLATRFAERWARPKLTADKWWRALAPLSGDSLAELLRDTDPANVPATEVTGAPKATTSVRGDAVFEVPTNEGTLVLGLHKADGKWRVIRIIDFRSSGGR